MGTCKDCRFWISHIQRRGHAWHECGIVDTVARGTHIEAYNMAIFTEISDDHGLETGLHTGPDFGCTLFEEQKS